MQTRVYGHLDQSIRTDTAIVTDGGTGTDSSSGPFEECDLR